MTGPFSKLFGKSGSNHERKHSKDQGESGKTFNILPHPAKTNNPNDLDHTGPQVGAPRSSQPSHGSQGGFDPKSAGTATAYNAKGPYIPDQAYMANVEPPKTREQLKARSEELNK